MLTVVAGTQLLRFNVKTAHLAGGGGGRRHCALSAPRSAIAAGVAV